ncbi:MAG: hypothetical protein BWY63_01416 [Chloroflexi bacterium ADurb.Bin360]|nr:MAG: hypothetical protein BWY63_01416 [Chloroflexi bacterium ADurb.Bin360]
MALATMVGPIHFVLIDPALQLAITISLASHTLVGVVGEQHREHEAS